MDTNQMEKISRKIKAQWPGAEVSVIAGKQDRIGPVFSVRNNTIEGLDKLSRSLDHVVVEIEGTGGHHVLLIPIEPIGTQQGNTGL